jgi:peptidoglycan/LPS O-acetylase OafA/YrhL
MNVRAERFPLVDSLRAIAALSVLALHAAYFAGMFSSNSVLLPYIAQAGAGVSIFFAISGFLLYRPFVRARLLDLPPVSARAYGWRRFLRVVPAFWVALAVIAIWLGSDLWSSREVVRNFGFLQLYYGGAGVIPQAWTLCVEVAFYASLPLWAGLMRRMPGRDFEGRLRTELWAVSALVAGSVAYSAVLVYSHSVRATLLFPAAVLSALPGFMDQLGLGMLLAVVSVWVEKRPRGALPRPLAYLARSPLVCWLIAVAAIVAVAQVLGFNIVYTPGEFMARHLADSLIAVAVLIPAVFGDAREGLVRRVMGNRVLLYLGLISYGFYLYHWAVLEQLRRWKQEGGLGFLTSSASWFVLGFAGALVAGSLSYYLVERPALSLKRLVPLRPRQDDEALAEPAPAAPVSAP